MIIQDVIERCEKLGVKLYLEDDFLYPEPAGRLPAQLIDQMMANRDKLIEAIRSGRTLDRAVKWKQALRWLDAKAMELRVTTNDPAYGFMLEALDDRYDILNDAWCDATDEEFVQALREYAAVGVRALRVGIESEDEVAERRDEVVSAGQVFRERRWEAI